MGTVAMLEVLTIWEMHLNKPMPTTYWKQSTLKQMDSVSSGIRTRVHPHFSMTYKLPIPPPVGCLKAKRSGRSQPERLLHWEDGMAFLGLWTTLHCLNGYKLISCIHLSTYTRQLKHTLSSPFTQSRTCRRIHLKYKYNGFRLM